MGTLITETLKRFQEKEIDYKTFHDSLCGIVNSPDIFNAISEEGKEIILTNWAHPNGVDISKYYPDIEKQKDMRKRMVKAITHARYRRLETWCYEKDFIHAENNEYHQRFWLDAEQFQYKFLDGGLPHLTCFVNSEKNDSWGIDFTETGYRSKIYFNEDVLLLYNKIVVEGKYLIT